MFNEFWKDQWDGASKSDEFSYTSLKDAFEAGVKAGRKAERKAEREACAKIAEKYETYVGVSKDIAAEIRERGK